ncbi:MAG: ABC transporter [Gammaproteobacteria bacterium]|nr:ABC transporter [Gammaproteobacteria bacterium]
MSTPLLSIQGLSVEARQSDDVVVPIVSHVDLEIRRGEVLGLVGESGAGKSTIGMAAMGYTRAGCQFAGGSVHFDGLELTTASRVELRSVRGLRIAYVAQSAAGAFNPAHRLLAQCAEGAAQHGMMSRSDAVAVALRLMQQLDLPQPRTLGRRFPHQVSGGQLQRAMVAMAMCCGPDLIVFDEPTTALDVATQVEVLRAIHEAIRTLNTAALYISHDLSVVAQVADQLAVIRKGLLVETGPAREVLAYPKAEYTKALLDARAVRSTPERATPERIGPDGITPEAIALQGSTSRGAMPAGTPPVLMEVDDVTAAYGRSKPVLRNLSLTVRRGTTLALVGPSGCGKSTLARVVAGLLPPAAGLVRFDGNTLPKTFKRRDRESLRLIQMIYQSPDVALNPRQRVAHILARPLRFYFELDNTAITARVDELLRMVELTPAHGRRLSTQLSGGEKQRVCIARALAAEPKLMICDEVTSALDPLIADGVLNLLATLQAETGVSYLFISHDLGLVQRVADDIVVMRDGEAIVSAPMAVALTPPLNPDVAELLDAIPTLDPDWLSARIARGDEV